jgi:hypothetical protein
VARGGVSARSGPALAARAARAGVSTAQAQASAGKRRLAAAGGAGRRRVLAGRVEPGTCGSTRSGPSGERPGKGERRRGPRQSGNERCGTARGHEASGRRRWCARSAVGPSRHAQACGGLRPSEQQRVPGCGALEGRARGGG